MKKFVIKHKIKLTIILSLSTIIYLTYQLPKYYEISYIVKQLSILSLFSYITYLWMMYYYKKIELRSSKVKILKVFTLSVFFLVLSIFSSVQLTIIKREGLPEEYSCTYYDNYDNILYETHYNTTCPSFDIVEDDNGYIHYTGIESVEAYNYSYHRYNGLSLRGGAVEAKLLFDVYVKYEDNNIVEHNIRMSQVAIITIEEDTYYEYVSNYFTVTNTFSNTEFTSIKNEYIYKDMYYSENEISINNFGHHDFTGEISKSEKTIQATLTGTVFSGHTYSITRTTRFGDDEPDYGTIADIRSYPTGLSVDSHIYIFSTIDWNQDIETHISIYEGMDIQENNYVGYYQLLNNDIYKSSKVIFRKHDDYTIIDTAVSYFISPVGKSHSSQVYTSILNDDTYIEIGSFLTTLSKIKALENGYVVITYNTYNIDSLIPYRISIDSFGNIEDSYYLDYERIIYTAYSYNDIVFNNNPLYTLK